MDYNNYKYGDYLCGNLNNELFELFEMVVHLNQFIQVFKTTSFTENDIEEKINNESIRIICGSKMYYRECLLYIVCKYWDYLISSVMNKSIFDSLINELEACVMNRELACDEIKDYLSAKVCISKFKTYNKYKNYKCLWPFNVYDLIEYKLI